MGLQVRLRHALGERVLEIPPRAVDDPVVVGRGADADVQVPSVNVGTRHVVVFVHDGHWVVQDCATSHATYVNGEALRGPRALNAGDMIVLGTDANAPMIEIDPDGVTLGHAGHGAAAALAAPPTGGAGYPGHPAAAPVPPYPYAPASRMVTTGSRAPQAGGYVPPAPAAQSYDHAPTHEAEHHDDETGWTAANAGARRSPYTRRKHKTSDAAIGVTVVAAIAIVGVVAYLVYQRRQEQDPAPLIARVGPKKEVVIDAGPAKRVPNSIFSDDSGRGPGAPVPPGYKPPKTGYDRLEDTANLKRPGAPPDLTDDQPPVASGKRAKPSTRSPGGKKRADDAKPADDDVISETDPTFKRIENAYYSPDPAKALLTFQAYEEEFPRKHTARIADYREQMLDKIWWERIESLVEKRQALTQTIKETQLAIKEETEEAHKKTVLEPRLEEQKSQLARLGEKLTKEMGYTIATPPPITEEPALNALRAKRDKRLYEPWKKRVLKHILEKHGDYPWASEK